MKKVMYNGIEWEALGIFYTKGDTTSELLDNKKYGILKEYIWEQYNGEVPKGYYLQLDKGSMSDFDISKLHLEKLPNMGILMETVLNVLKSIIDFISPKDTSHFNTLTS